MASITSSSGISTTLGSYSGVTSDDIEQLLAADSAKKTLAQNKITTFKNQQTAWNDIRTRLNSLSNRISDLQKDDTFATKKVTNSNETAVSITATAEAPAQTYQLKVTQLATATKLVGSRIAESTTTALNQTGTLTLSAAQKSGEEAQTIDIDVTADDALKTLVEKINGKADKTNLTASIMDNRLVLTAKKSGEQEFTVSGDLSESLGLTGENTTYTAGKAAEFELDGLKLTRDTNTITDAIEGMTFTLKKPSDEAVKVDITVDQSKTIQAVKDLVTQYNSTMSFISDNLSVGDPSQTDNKTGKLSGDSTLRRLQETLSNLFTSNFVSGTALKANDLGISLIDRDGTLGLNEETLTKKLTEDPQGVKQFFVQQNPDAKGTISDKNGYTAQLKKVVDGYLVDSTSSKGILTTKTTSIDASIKELNKQITRFDDILTMKRDRYVTMFTRLDQAMMQAQEQLNYFTSQTSNNNN